MSYLVIRKMFDDGQVVLNETGSLREAIEISGNGSKQGYIVKTVDVEVLDKEEITNPTPVGPE